ncbi:MAG TPA: DMT family transporter [Candidatus Babeliales bacterium]|nr:DMT family transporter [Candidatus Babeliales bacterium]
MILILILYMLLASTFTIGKAVLQYIQPIFFIAVRMILSGGLLLGYAYLFDRSHWRFRKQDLWAFLKLATFHIYCAFIFEFLALRTMLSAKACLLYSFSPFITALFSYLIFREQLRLRQIIGLIIGFIGFIPVLASCAMSEGTSFLCISSAELLLLLSVVSSVYGWILLKEAIDIGGYSPVMANGCSMLLGGIAALCTSLLYEGMPVLYRDVTDTQGPLESLFHGTVDGAIIVGIYTILLILIANVVFYNLYGYLLMQYSMTLLSFAGFTCPLFAAFYGWLFLGEVISSSFIISLISVIVGLTLFYQQELLELERE